MKPTDPAFPDGGPQGGMDMRAYLAAKAMAAIVSRLGTATIKPETEQADTVRAKERAAAVARGACHYADALLDELAKGLTHAG